jgi:hypothetical protein
LCEQAAGRALRTARTVKQATLTPAHSKPSSRAWPRRAGGAITRAAAGLTGLAVVLTACSQPAGHAGDAAGGMPYCSGEYPTGNWIALLAPGHTARDVQNAQINVVATIPDTTTGKTYLILDHAPTGPARQLHQADLAPLITSGVLLSAASYNGQASEPDLHSCDMKLSDKPAAQPYITAAENTAEADGLATSADFASTASPFLISDDPLDPDSYIVTLDVPGPRQTGLPTNMPTTLYNQRSIITLVTKPTPAVTAIGQGIIGQ